ncbi:MAG: hypothetical protein JSS79_02005 [Bacteroidetes bacterium]|nr:hypothetical protein [Bacteroidota bacterium]
MSNLNFIKVSLFRFVAGALLALSVSSVMMCESNVCAVNRIFVKSHSPVSDNYLLALSADDKEDIDDDNSVELPEYSGLIHALPSLIDVGESVQPSRSREASVIKCQVYLWHRQLLI